MTPRRGLTLELPQFDAGVTERHGAAVPVGLEQSQLDAYVTVVFNRLRDKAHTETAIRELHAVTQEYPEYDLNPHLLKSSGMFAQYVMKNLARAGQKQS
jgi:hypothetical protein